MFNSFKMKNMKFVNTIFQKILFACIFFLCLQFSGSLYAQEDSDKASENNAVNISLVVVDTSGIPLPGAQIVIGEGSVHTKTDAQGNSGFKASPSDVITVSSKGYEKYEVSVEQILKNNTIKLRRAKLLMSDDDDVPLPFMTLKKRYINF